MMSDVFAANSGGETSSSGQSANDNDNEEDYSFDYDDYVELTDQTLLKIEQNDPSITLLRWDYSYFVNDDDDDDNNEKSKRVGNAIGNNTHIKGLGGDTNFLDTNLCRGIANNQSIKHLDFMDIDDLSEEKITTLFPIFEHNYIESIHLCQCEIDGGSEYINTALTSALSKFNTLRSISLDSLCVDNLDEFVDIMRELQRHHNLSSLGLNFGWMESTAWSSVGEVLKACKVKALEMVRCSINDENAALLVNALKENDTLRELFFFGYEFDPHDRDTQLYAAGWRSLFSLVTSHSLEKLSITEADIYNDDVIELAEKLANNSTLKELSLGGKRNLTRVGWRAIFTSLQTTSALESLTIDMAKDVNDGDLAVLVSVIGNSTLKELSFEGYYNSDLSVQRSISTQGWRPLAQMLGDTNRCKLEKLSMRSNIVGDEVVIDMAHALVNNTCLREWDMTNNYLITARGWDALSTLLCDMSSIGNTYSSNHIISVDSQLTTTRLNDLSNINKNKSISDAARKKIMKYHFTSTEQVGTSLGMRVVSEMDWVVLPQVIAWAGRKHDNEGCTTLYQLLRCIPELVEDQTLTKTGVGEKRKIGCL